MARDTNTLDADAAFGAVFGAFIGDAAGATLEFVKTKITDEMVDEALTFPGGGFLGVGRG